MSSYGHLSGTYVKVSSPVPHVALVELGRAPVNAFNEEFWTELGHVFDRISEEPTVRAVVLASSIPKLFSAGIDLGSLSGSLIAKPGQDPSRRALQLQGHITSFQASISAMERCRYPVIVATHGVAYGLSVDIIAACDVRYAASNTVFSIKEVDVGLAADIGTLARLPKITGNPSLAAELAFTAREFSAAEALAVGLVSRVVNGGRDEVVKAALETAALVAQKSPIAVLGTKKLLLHARDHTVAENLEYTAVWNSAMLQTQDIPDAFAAMKKKQTAQFGPILPKL